MSKIKLGVIFGGKSGEHEVSRVSATSVIKAADKEKYEVITIGITKQGEWLLYEGPIEALADGSWEETARAQLKADPEHFSFALLGTGNRSLKDIVDFALPILHGPNGEDGTVQGLLELADIPYGGCGVLGCAATMDKIVAKKIFQAEGISQVPYVDFGSELIGCGAEELVNEKLQYPVFVKPSNMGSSVGITKVKKPEDLHDALVLAAKYDERIVVENGVDARELETAVMGNYNVIAGEVGEVLPAAEFYDYDAKYNSPDSQTLVPAPITKEQRETIRSLAIKAYKATGCCGFSRVDFLMDRATGEIYLNEINAIPGFTSISMFPMLMQAAGMSYPQIIEKIIELGYERYNAENNR